MSFTSFYQVINYRSFFSHFIKTTKYETRKRKIDINFDVSKSKRVLVWEKSKSFTQPEIPKWKKKTDMKIYKHAQICYERENMEESSAKRLPHNILENFREDFSKVFQNLTQIWKNCISKPRCEKPTYPKAFKWL